MQIEDVTSVAARASHWNESGGGWFLLPKGGVAARFGSDAMWSTAGNVAMQGLSFCTTLLVARLLTKQEFGAYALFLTALTLLGTLSDMGLGVTISTATAELRDTAPEKLGKRIAAAYWIAAGLIALICAVLAALPEKNLGVLPPGGGAVYLGLACGTLCVNTVSILQTAELSGYQGFRALAQAQILRGVALLPLCTAAAIWLKLTGVIAASVTATLLSVLMQHAALVRERRRRLVRVRKRADWREMRAALGCSWPVFVVNVANAAGNWGSNISVAVSHAAGLAAVAEFGAAAQVRNLILFLPNIVGQVLMPTMAGLKTGRATEGWRLARMALASSTGLAASLAAGAIVFRGELAGLFGSQYRDASTTVALIAIGGVVCVMQSTLSYALIGYGHLREVSIASVAGALTMISVAAALIRWDSTLGSRTLALAYIGASTVQFAILARVARRATRRGEGTAGRVE